MGSRFEKFVQTYGIPIAILIGMVFIAGSIRLSFPPSKSGEVSPVPPPAPAAAGTKAVNIDTAGLPMLGDPNAEISIVEFGDFQCPFCGRLFNDVVLPLKDKYIQTGKVRFYFANYAFLGQESLDAGAAAKCAGEQGKFWEYHDYLYTHQNGENQGAFSIANLKKFAAILRLNTADFNQCLDSKKFEAAVNQETMKGQEYGVEGTPATFVNGRLIGGAQPFSSFVTVIDSLLKK